MRTEHTDPLTVAIRMATTQTSPAPNVVIRLWDGLTVETFVLHSWTTDAEGTMTSSWTPDYRKKP